MDGKAPESFLSPIRAHESSPLDKAFESLSLESKFSAVSVSVSAPAVQVKYAATVPVKERDRPYGEPPRVWSLESINEAKARTRERVNPPKRGRSLAAGFQSPSQSSSSSPAPSVLSPPPIAHEGGLELQFNEELGVGSSEPHQEPIQEDAVPIPQRAVEEDGEELATTPIQDSLLSRYPFSPPNSTPPAGRIQGGIQDLAQSIIDKIHTGCTSSNREPTCEELGISDTDLVKIAKYIRQTMNNEPRLLSNLKAPIKVYGDVHGHLYDLLQIFRHYGGPESDIGSTNYLFLGDYVDRGNCSVQMIALLFSYKILYPNSFFMIRGNHEDTRMTDFPQDCKKQYPDPEGDAGTIDLNVRTAFNGMPLAAIIEDTIFCCHGGISPNFGDVREKLRSLDRRNLDRPIDHPEYRHITGPLMWSDPALSSSLRGCQPITHRNPQGAVKELKELDVACVYDEETVIRFLEENKFQVMLRAHEVVPHGFQLFAHGRVCTVFSASQYGGRMNNSASFIDINWSSPSRSSASSASSSSSSSEPETPRTLILSPKISSVLSYAELEDYIGPPLS